MKDYICYTKSTKHWSSIVGMLIGLLFFLTGVCFVLYVIKARMIVSILIFGCIFIFGGGVILISTIDYYFIKPGNFFFKANKKSVSWGGTRKQIEMKFSEIGKIKFYVSGTDMDSIDFYKLDGNVIKFMNRSLMSKEELLNTFQFVNLHFDGRVELNDA